MTRSTKRSGLAALGVACLVLCLSGCHAHRHEPWNARPCDTMCPWPPPCATPCLGSECYGYDQTCWRPWPGQCSECPEVYVGTAADGSQNNNVGSFPTEVPAEIPAESTSENSVPQQPDAVDTGLPEQSADELPADATSESAQPETSPSDHDLEELELPPPENDEAPAAEDDFPTDETQDDEVPDTTENDGGTSAAEGQPAILFPPRISTRQPCPRQFLTTSFPGVTRMPSPLAIGEAGQSSGTGKPVLLMEPWDPAGNGVATRRSPHLSSDPTICPLKHPQMLMQWHGASPAQRSGTTPATGRSRRRSGASSRGIIQAAAYLPRFDSAPREAPEERSSIVNR